MPTVQVFQEDLFTVAEMLKNAHSSRANAFNPEQFTASS